MSTRSTGLRLFAAAVALAAGVTALVVVIDLVRGVLGYRSVMRRHRCVIGMLAAVAVALPTGIARVDGDPASDILLGSTVLYPSGIGRLPKRVTCGGGELRHGGQRRARDVVAMASGRLGEPRHDPGDRRRNARDPVPGSGAVRRDER